MEFLGCKACQHFDPGSVTCKAFPSGIPFAYASGQHHDSVVDGQKGEFVYEAIEGAIANFAKAAKKDDSDPIGDSLDNLFN